MIPNSFAGPQGRPTMKLKRGIHSTGANPGGFPRYDLAETAETALQLCRADTAGISLLEKHDGAEVFRWEALAGVFGDRINNTMPRDASPCGTTIDRNTTQLMYMAERIFPALKAEPPVVEALLIPFCVGHKPIGLGSRSR